MHSSPGFLRPSHALRASHSFPSGVPTRHNIFITSALGCQGRLTTLALASESWARWRSPSVTEAFALGCQGRLTTLALAIEGLACAFPGALAQPCHN